MIINERFLTGCVLKTLTEQIHLSQEMRNLILFYFILFILFCSLLFFFFLAVLGLRCCVWAFSSCGEWGLLFIVVRGLLIAVASLAAEHRL